MDIDDNHAELGQLQQPCPNDQKEQLLKLIFTPEGEEAQSIVASTNLSTELRQALLNLLYEFKDVFELIYAQMP